MCSMFIALSCVCGRTATRLNSQFHLVSSSEIRIQLCRWMRLSNLSVLCCCHCHLTKCILKLLSLWFCRYWASHIVFEWAHIIIERLMAVLPKPKSSKWFRKYMKYGLNHILSLLTEVTTIICAPSCKGKPTGATVRSCVNRNSGLMN